MAKDLVYHSTTAKALADQLDALINGGTGAGTLRLYDADADPTNGDAVPTGTVIVTLTLAATAFGAAAVSGSDPTRTADITLADISPVAVSSNGTASHFAIFHGGAFLAADLIMKGTVGTSAANSDTLQFSSVTFTTDDTVDLTHASCVLKIPLNNVLT